MNEFIYVAMKEHGQIKQVSAFSLNCCVSTVLYFSYYTVTVRHKNTPNFFYHNFYNTWPILIEIDMQCLG